MGYGRKGGPIQIIFNRVHPNEERAKTRLHIDFHLNISTIAITIDRYSKTRVYLNPF